MPKNNEEEGRRYKDLGASLGYLRGTGIGSLTTEGRGKGLETEKNGRHNDLLRGNSSVGLEGQGGELRQIGSSGQTSVKFGDEARVKPPPKIASTGTPKKKFP